MSQPEIAKKIHKTPYFGVQGHSRSLNIVVFCGVLRCLAVFSHTLAACPIIHGHSFHSQIIHWSSLQAINGLNICNLFCTVLMQWNVQNMAAVTSRRKSQWSLCSRPSSIFSLAVCTCLICLYIRLAVYIVTAILWIVINKPVKVNNYRNFCKKCWNYCSAVWKYQKQMCILPEAFILRRHCLVKLPYDRHGRETQNDSWSELSTFYPEKPALKISMQDSRQNTLGQTTWLLICKCSNHLLLHISWMFVVRDFVWLEETINFL